MPPTQNSPQIDIEKNVSMQNIEKSQSIQNDKIDAIFYTMCTQFFLIMGIVLYKMDKL